MKKEEVHIGDIHRWLFGTTPPEFMVEITIRTILIYLGLLIAFRLLGKRMNGQITLVELAVMMTLGAIVSPVMQLPDKGILYGFLVLLVALIFQRSLNLWAFKSEKIEHLTVGKLIVMVKDGIIQTDGLKKADVTQEQLFSMLREKKIMNLGKVKRAYLEAFGALNIFEADAPRPGLPVLPTNDPLIREMQEVATSGEKVCCRCGNVQQQPTNQTPCTVCGAQDWSEAYIDNSKSAA
jgi:uncharacterized membrane protein YcaP (DUF421 family)